MISTLANASVHTSTTWNKSDLKVCFGSREEAAPRLMSKLVKWTDEAKENIRKVIESEFNAKRTSLNFYGFEDCMVSGRNSDIIILAVQNNTKGSTVGGAVTSSYVGRALFYPSHTYHSIRGVILLPASVDVEESTIIHEFGHAAGLHNEQDHPDAYESHKFCSNTKKDTSRVHGREYGKFDSESVMFDCYIKSVKGRHAKLSQGDIDVLRKIYGKFRQQQK